MKEKRKKIVARVGAMFAALLLVLAMALPCFAAGNLNVNEAIKTAYGLTDESLMWGLIEASYYNPENYPYLLQFTLAPVGRQIKVGDYETINGEPSSYYPTGVAKSNSWESSIEQETYIVTSHTTSGNNKYVYIDFMTAEGRAIRARIKINNTTLEVLETELSGNLTYEGNGEDFYFVAAFSEEELPLFTYLINKGLIQPTRNAYLNYQDFENGYEQGRIIGNQEGNAQISLLEGVTAIFKAPLTLIDGILDFDIFGVNLAGAVHVLLTMAILGVVITVIWKAVK